MNSILNFQTIIAIDVANQASQQSDMFMQIATKTPIWVWPLFVILIAAGLSRTKTRRISTGRLMVLPFALVITASVSLFFAGITPLNNLAFLLGLISGALSGHHIARDDGTVRLEGNMIELRGEWLTMAIILGVFVLKFASGIVNGAAPTVGQSAEFQFASLSIGGFLAGITMGRIFTQLGIWSVKLDGPNKAQKS